MVLAALCEHYLPSHRGLARDHQSLAVANDRHLWQQHHYQNSERSIVSGSHHSNSSSSNPYNKNSILDLSQNHDDDNHSSNNNQLNNSMLNNTSLHHQHRKASTKPKRNRCKASKFLASCAADFDVLTDWLFYAHCQSTNREAFQTTGVYQIPPWMVGMVLASCLIGTTLWLVLATDGAIATPFLRKFGYDKLSLGHILLMCVVLEDLPQVVLTFLIEDYFEADQEFNNYAVVNVVASLYDILIKLAEAYDQRAGKLQGASMLIHNHNDCVWGQTHNTLLFLFPFQSSLQQTLWKRGTGARRAFRRTLERLCAWCPFPRKRNTTKTAICCSNRASDASMTLIAGRIDAWIAGMETSKR